MSRFAERLAELGFTTYAQYLASPIWKSFKGRYREAGLQRSCTVCGDPFIHLHHITYARLGCEKLDDVIPLCRDHHNQTHACLKANKWYVDQTHKVVVLLRSGERFDESLLVQREQKESRPRPNWRFFAARSQAMGQSKKGKRKKGKNNKPREWIDPQKESAVEQILELGTDAFSDLARELIRLQKETGQFPLRSCVNIIAGRDARSLQLHLSRMRSIVEQKALPPSKGKKKKKTRKQKTAARQQQAKAVKAKKVYRPSESVVERASLSEEERRMRAIAAGVIRPVAKWRHAKEE